MNNWLYLGTENIDFHYPDNLIIKYCISHFTKKRQEHFNFICNKLKTIWNKENLDFYIYNDNKQTIEIWDKEVNLSFVLPDKLMIHMEYLGNAEHETTHLISHYMTKNSTKLKILDEGLAVFMSEPKKKLKNRLYTILVEENHKINLRTLFFNNEFSIHNFMIYKNYYLGAVFVRFLIRRYSLNKFKEAWNETAHENNEKNKLEFERVYHKSIEELEKEFISWLNI